jgi:hypothetical protein
VIATVMMHGLPFARLFMATSPVDCLICDTS